MTYQEILTAAFEALIKFGCGLAGVPDRPKQEDFKDSP